MRKRFRSVKWIVQAVMLTLAFASLSSVRAADFIRQCFPVPISVEGERVRSSLLLQFDIERYGIPFEAFAGGRLDNFETSFSEFVQALRAGDKAKVAALRPGYSPEQTQEITNRYLAAFAGPQTIKVVGRIYLRDSQLFVWEWPGPRGPMRRGFTVETTPQGPMRVEIVYSGRPLETLIVDLMQQEVTHPREYAAVDPNARYQYAFPLAGPGKSSAHPVILYFNGDPLDGDLFSADRPKANEAPGGASAAGGPLAAYRAAYSALKDRDLDRFWASYTDKSRDKLRAWYQKVKPEEFDSYQATATRPRIMRFLLDASPVAIVFYTTGTEKKLYHEYLIKRAEGYKVTNAYFEGFLDDILGDPALFPTDIEPFRKNILGAK